MVKCMARSLAFRGLVFEAPEVHLKKPSSPCASFWPVRSLKSLNGRVQNMAYQERACSREAGIWVAVMNHKTNSQRAQDRECQRRVFTSPDLVFSPNGRYLNTNEAFDPIRRERCLQLEMETDHHDTSGSKNSWCLQSRRRDPLAWQG